MHKSRDCGDSGGCVFFRGGIAFQANAGNTAVCTDSAGLLADCQIRRIEGVAMALAGDCRETPLIVISAAFCVVTYLAQAKAGAVSDMVSLPLGLRVSNALMSYIRYIGKIFYPTSLAVLYPLDVNGYPSWKVILCLLLLLAFRRQ